MLTDTVLKDRQLDQLYDWVDSLTLSRPKKNINRDFSDAVMMAEVVNLYFPKSVQLHNYPPGNSLKAKTTNWRTLNNKVLNKLGISLTEEDCQRLSRGKPMSIEPLLFEFKNILNEQKRQIQANTVQNFGEEIAVGGREPEREQNIAHKLNISSKVEELKEVYGLLKEKIEMVERSIERKDAHIRELQDIIRQYTPKGT